MTTRMTDEVLNNLTTEAGLKVVMSRRSQHKSCNVTKCRVFST